MAFQYIHKFTADKPIGIERNWAEKKRIIRIAFCIADWFNS